jgi:hypothetical protein
MILRFFLSCCLTAGIGLLTASAGAAAENKKSEASLNDLSMEVTALQTIGSFKMTAAQMRKLQKLAAETAEKPRKRTPAKASAEYRQAVIALRAALVDNVDDGQIDQLSEELEELREADRPKLDDTAEITDAARRRAPEVLRLMSARQVAAYVALNAQEIHGPREVLTKALDQARDLKAKEWKEFRDTVSDEVGRLVAGIDEAKAEKIAIKVVVFLSKVRELTADDFAKQRPTLEKEARQIAGGAHPTDVLKHDLEYALAELLSNPRLAEVLKARLK